MFSTSPHHNHEDNRIAASKLLAGHLLEVHSGVTQCSLSHSLGGPPLWIEWDRSRGYTHSLIDPLKSVRRFVTHILWPGSMDGMRVCEEGDFQGHSRDLKSIVDLGAWGLTCRHVEWAPSLRTALFLTSVHKERKRWKSVF